MNRLKTGKILRVPEPEQVTLTGQSEAVKEVRVQAANWNVYRRKLAEAAGETPAQESKSAASGKIVTTVDDKAAGKQAPKEVLKLSKGEPAAPGKAVSGKGAPRTAAERMRLLEEEAIAREKALAEVNDRIAQLEKTIKDMQRLLEVKGVAPPAPAAKPAPQPVPAAKPEPAPPMEKPAAVEPPKGEAPKVEAPKAEPGVQEQPKPKPKIVPPPPPPPEPDLIDQILGEPLYLVGVGGVLVLLGGVGYFFMRRRRAQAAGEDETGEKKAPKLGKAAGAAPAMAAAAVATPPAGGGEDVDPLAEADLYLNFGRDVQAEEVLKEALQKNPKHEEAQLKLLQIYAGRKDKVTFEKIAKSLHTQTGGAGDNWLKAAAMGYAIDSGNAMYEAGKSAPVAAMLITGGAAGGTDLDFDLELSPTAVTKTDVELEAGKTMIMQPGELAGMAAAPDSAAAIHDITADSGAARAIAESAPAAPDFTLNVPAGAQLPAELDITLDTPGDETVKTSVTGDSAVPMAAMIDFNFDATAPAPAAPAGEDKAFTHDGTVILSPEKQDKAAGLGMDFDLGATAEAAPEAKPAEPASALPSLEPDFKLDLGGDIAAPLVPELKLDDIDLHLDAAPKAEAAPAEGGAKDDHWYDVQTKFDLAKAYQEMGDKDGAREILQEVIKEGDAGQQDEAKKLLDSLG
ncbi:MAG: hypothetical protein HY525_03130 [Betaproteobacteria bacterium]|nr:hypothetical protein [Betaproteobacteria bacterium]